MIIPLLPIISHCSKLFSRLPHSFGNVDIDTKGILYSVTQSAEGNAIKKHDVAGLNLLTPNMEDEQDFVDVCILSLIHI